MLTLTSSWINAWVLVETRRTPMSKASTSRIVHMTTMARRLADGPVAKPSSASPVTLHDVARLADVSLMTVSRALREPGRLSASTLAKVQAAVAATGYVPNLMAGGLKSSRTRLVAALVPTMKGQLFSEMILSLTTALSANGYQVMLGQMGYENSREDALLRAIIGRRPDAIVTTGVMHSVESRRLLVTSGIPVVETWDYTSSPVDMLVGVSHEALGSEVCRYLHRQGRRRLALISGNDERAQKRRRGFLGSARALGLPEPAVKLVESPTRHAHGRSAMAELIERGVALDGVFCSSDMLALGVMTEAQVRGLKVPDAIAIVGFGDLDFAATVQPSLSTVRIDGTGMGSIAARMVMDRIEGRDVSNPVVDLGFTVVQRCSG